MYFHSFHGLQLSALGLGCMRLPNKGTNEAIDMEASAVLVDHALKNGVNYFDTAWGYHGGNSEKAMGELLSAYPRESYYLATKFPGFNNDIMKRVKETFTEQLSRCRTDYFDFYLYHNVCENNIDGYMDPQNGIFEYLTEQKREGKIRFLGFSTHGSLETMKRFLDAYHTELSFCQIQLNWLDYSFQNAAEKIKLIASYGLPVWVMEPVRGGSLCTLAPKYQKKLAAVAPDRTLPDWAFRYLQGIPEVMVTLSGMSNMTQLQENLDTFAERRPLGAEEIALLHDIAYEMTHEKSVPCTACRYCTDVCPQGLDIPTLIGIYNRHTYSDGGFIAAEELKELAEDRKPTACLHCQACESVCPQNIGISEIMSDFSEKCR